MDLIPHYFELDLFFQFIRCSELVLFYIHLFNIITSYYAYDKLRSSYLILVFSFNSWLNHTLKNIIAKPIFYYFNDYIPILGQGTRPFGAVNCTYFNPCPSINAASTFGFPSGHCQFAGMYSGFMISDIINKHKYTNYSIQDIISILIYILYVLVMIYSRVWIYGCHTLSQSICGSCIGLLVGYINNNIKNEFVKALVIMTT